MTTRRPSTKDVWLSPAEDRAWRGFLFTHLRLEVLLARDMGHASDLSYTDYMILVALTDTDEGALRLYELSRVLGWERSRLSHHLARMSTRELITRSECPQDHRGVVISVTRHGRTQLAAEAPHHAAAVRRLFIDRLTSDQLSTLADLGDTVGAALAEEL